MQPIGPRTSTLGTTYSAAQVLSLLQSPCGVETALFEQVDGNGNTLADISAFVAGESQGQKVADSAQGPQRPTIQHDTTQTVPRTITLSIRAAANLDWYNDRIRVWRRVLAPDGGWVEFRIGTFVPTAPGKATDSSGVWRHVTYADESQLCNDTELLTPYTSPAGSSYLAEAQAALLRVIPAARVLATPNSTSLSASQTWSAGTTVLQQVNDLLSGIGYGAVWFDEQGFARMHPLPDYSTVAPDFLFDLTQASTSFAASPLPQLDDTTQAVNSCTFSGQDTRLQTFSAYYENTSPSSPVSTVNFRRKHLNTSDSKVSDRNSALKRARIAVQEGSRIYRPLTLSTMAWPLSQHLDVYQLAYDDPDDGLFVANYVETAWSIDLRPGGLTAHTLTQISPGV